MHPLRGTSTVGFLMFSLFAASGCTSAPASFVERVDGVELSYVQRFIATEWRYVFWNEDGTIDELNFLEMPIHDDDLREVALNPRLRVLKLGATDISDAGLAHLKDLRGLQMLGLRRTKVTGEGLRYLAGMRELRSLALAETAVDDDSLKYLEGLDRLAELGLNATRVTDAGLQHLDGLPALAMLHLTDCEVTEQGLAALRKARPGLKIYPWDAGEEKRSLKIE